MAEEDTDIAVLRQLQAGQDMMSENDGANGTEGKVSITEEDNNHQEEQKVEDDQSLRVISPSSTSVPAVAVAEDESRASSVASSRRPRTVGGFLADDSDDEDQTASTSLQVPPTQNRILSPSPLQNSIAPAGSNGDSTTGVVNAPPVTSTGTSSHVQASPLAVTAAAPKARLPHDKVGILEDRIVSVPYNSKKYMLEKFDSLEGCVAPRGTRKHYSFGVC
jgi:cleavage stimulation factor subunit 3